MKWEKCKKKKEEKKIQPRKKIESEEKTGLNSIKIQLKFN